MRRVRGTHGRGREGRWGEIGTQPERAREDPNSPYMVTVVDPKGTQTHLRLGVSNRGVHRSPRVCT